MQTETTEALPKLTPSIAKVVVYALASDMEGAMKFMGDLPSNELRAACEWCQRIADARDGGDKAEVDGLIDRVCDCK
jgi:hypothetical protein